MCAIPGLRLLRNRCVFPRVSFPHLDADSEGDGRAAGQKEADSQVWVEQSHPQGRNTHLVLLQGQ